ncbi:hypothetical protein O3P69_019326 [Scylla paramamosain]|uniref:Uncharacterized protein n=1 Tax=Scylla paramamosain TaxID=85552 RepID=A0AAW0SXA4_SCYPA
MEAKWSLNFPFDTFTFYKSKFQLGLPIKVPFPAAIIVGAGAGRKKRALGENEDARNMLEEHQLRRKEARKERLQIYQYLEGVLETPLVSTGLARQGRGCLLRAVCEVAEAPFDQGMIGEMINAVLTPSVAGRPGKEEEEEEEEEANRYHEYLEAEMQGKLEGKSIPVITSILTFLYVTSASYLTSPANDLLSAFSWAALDLPSVGIDLLGPEEGLGLRPGQLEVTERSQRRRRQLLFDPNKNVDPINIEVEVRFILPMFQVFESDNMNFEVPYKYEMDWPEILRRSGGSEGLQEWKDTIGGMLRDFEDMVSL